MSFLFLGLHSVRVSTVAKNNFLCSAGASLFLSLPMPPRRSYQRRTLRVQLVREKLLVNKEWRRADQLPPQMELDKVSLGTFATLWLALAVQIIASVASASIALSSRAILFLPGKIRYRVCDVGSSCRDRFSVAAIYGAGEQERERVAGQGGWEGVSQLTKLALAAATCKAALRKLWHRPAKWTSAGN